MPFPRSTGILLHPISFPSRGGIGDFGPAAYEFLNWLADARQGLWQVLPLGPPANGNSPYSSTSAFAGNPLLISLERLEDRGWIDRACLAGFTDKVGPIDYGQVRATKPPLLAQAARNFLQHAPVNARFRFDAFCSKIPGGWTILSSTILCAIAWARNVGTNGRANSHGVSPLL